MKVLGHRAMIGVNMFAGELAPTERESADRFNTAFASVRRRAGTAPANVLDKISVDTVGGSRVAVPGTRLVMWPLWVWSAGQATGPDPEEIFSGLRRLERG